MVILNEGKMPNLLSYKYYIRPTAHQLYGNKSSKSKHHQNVQRIIKILALEGPMTTWEMAKIRFATDNSKIRSKEKEYRRLLIGRTDRGTHSDGIIDLNLVLVDSISTKRNSGNRYRLSLFGILYCLDQMNFSEKEVDRVAKNYEIILPLVFGKWGFLKSVIGKYVYNISLLGKGLLFDNLNIISIEKDEFYELISFFGIKVNTLTESFNEQKIGEAISLWFYVTMLYFPNLMEDKKIKGMKKFFTKFLEKIMNYKHGSQIFFQKQRISINNAQKN
ncbi:hypothetical protein BD31_I0486 [Candidatus Nitrosopumilus salaria BD31]|uniref:Uncharacterized protein n=1 Tax=Candidatus Nitrosopumilus salarius BD31 TaxID=859350 RepID=I3D0G6_9ARCH|nr:hypothetical protein [Candidatus Nitrosopumilus salaria]EIJ65209.1 hypothetical protein BD31_I0486 [Candidatus Nitrosopumilus salaria BD31]